MPAKKKPYTFHIDREQLAQLKVIASVSRGKPKVSGLIRDAIDDYVAEAAREGHVAEALRRATDRPRLVAVGQNSKTDRSKS